MPELIDIIDPPSEEEVGAVILAGLTKKENPVTDWIEGATMRTMYELEREVTFNLVSDAVPLMAAGAFTDTAEDEWATDLALYWYDRTRVPPMAGTQEVTLACTTGNGPHLITAGRTVLLGTDGSRYIAASGGTLSGGGTLSIDALAESPGAARGLVASLEVPLVGVTVQSAAIKIVALVPQYGSDEEGDAALMARADARWPDLDAIPDMDRVEEWARAASDEVTRVRLRADPVYAGAVIVVVAGASGAITGGAVTAVQDYFDARDPITDMNTALNATNLAVDTTGTVRYPGDWGTEQLQAAKDAADEQWDDYLASTRIGDAVRRAELIQAIMDTGAVDTDATIVGAGGDDNLALGTDEVPIPGDLPSDLTWEAY